MATLKNKTLIIHGWTYSIDKYQKISNLLKNNGVENEILKVPGLTTNIDKAWNLNDYVEWLKNKVDKEKEKVILIGHSNGGRIAASFTNKYPQKVEKLILIDSAGILHKDLYIKSKLIFFKTLAQVGKRLIHSALLKNLLYKIIGERDYNNANPLMKKTIHNLIRIDIEPILSKITTPTFIIWGENDKTTPISDAYIMHNLIHNSKLYVIKNAKHSPHFTNSEEVTKIIVKNLIKQK